MHRERATERALELRLDLEVLVGRGLDDARREQPVGEQIVRAPGGDRDLEPVGTGGELTVGARVDDRPHRRVDCTATEVVGHDRCALVDGEVRRGHARHVEPLADGDGPDLRVGVDRNGTGVDLGGERRLRAVQGVANGCVRGRGGDRHLLTRGVLTTGRADHRVVGLVDADDLDVAEPGLDVVRDQHHRTCLEVGDRLEVADSVTPVCSGSPCSHTVSVYRWPETPVSLTTVWTETLNM